MISCSGAVLRSRYPTCIFELKLFFPSEGLGDDLALPPPFSIRGEFKLLLDIYPDIKTQKLLAHCDGELNIYTELKNCTSYQITMVNCSYLTYSTIDCV